MKHKVPKTIEEFCEVTQHQGVEKGRKIQHFWTEGGHALTGKLGRFITDDLLRERFAFAGEIKLTREEAESMVDCFLVAEANLTPSKFDRALVKAAALLNSKLAREEMRKKLEE